ncbi:MAG TPA: hypothetical protein VF182_22440 [Candidatus Binatia bacterium]
MTAANYQPVINAINCSWGAQLMSNLPHHCKRLRMRFFFPAVSELSGSFRERQRLEKNFMDERFERSEAVERFEQ